MDEAKRKNKRDRAKGKAPDVLEDEAKRKRARERLETRKARNERIMNEQRDKKLSRAAHYRRMCRIAEASRAETSRWRVERTREEHELALVDSFGGSQAAEKTTLSHFVSPICWGYKLFSLEDFDSELKSPVLTHFSFEPAIGEVDIEEACCMKETKLRMEHDGLKKKIRDLVEDISFKDESGFKRFKDARDHNKERQILQAAAFQAVIDTHAEIEACTKRKQDAKHRIDTAGDDFKMLYHAENEFDDMELRLAELELQLEFAKKDSELKKEETKKAKMHFKNSRKFAKMFKEQSEKANMIGTSALMRGEVTFAVSKYAKRQRPESAAQFVNMRSRMIHRSRQCLKELEETLGLNSSDAGPVIHPACIGLGLSRLPDGRRVRCNPRRSHPVFFGYLTDLESDHGTVHPACVGLQLKLNHGFDATMCHPCFVEIGVEVDPEFVFPSLEPELDVVVSNKRGEEAENLPEDTCSICLGPFGLVSGCPGCWKLPNPNALPSPCEYGPCGRRRSTLTALPQETRDMFRLFTSLTSPMTIRYWRGAIPMITLMIKILPGGKVVKLTLDNRATIEHVYACHRSLAGEFGLKEYVFLLLPTVNGFFYLDPEAGKPPRPGQLTHKYVGGPLKLKDYNMTKTSTVALFQVPRNTHEAMAQVGVNYISQNCDILREDVNATFHEFTDQCPPEIPGEDWINKELSQMLCITHDQLLFWETEEARLAREALRTRIFETMEHRKVLLLAQQQRRRDQEKAEAEKRRERAKFERDQHAKLARKQRKREAEKMAAKLKAKEQKAALKRMREAEEAKLGSSRRSSTKGESQSRRSSTKGESQSRRSSTKGESQSRRSSTKKKEEENTNLP